MPAITLLMMISYLIAFVTVSLVFAEALGIL
jgi:hypothetical protein